MELELVFEDWDGEPTMRYIFEHEDVDGGDWVMVDGDVEEGDLDRLFPMSATISSGVIREPVALNDRISRYTAEVERPYIEFDYFETGDGGGSCRITGWLADNIKEAEEKVALKYHLIDLFCSENRVEKKALMKLLKDIKNGS